MITNVKQLRVASDILRRSYPHIKIERTVDTLIGVDPITRQVIRHYESRGIRLLNQINPR
jgi:hypothetical protein